MINRWHYFSYEKQPHLHVSENLLKEDRHTDMADLDSHILKHLLHAHLIPVFRTTITCLMIELWKKGGLEEVL